MENAEEMNISYDLLIYAFSKENLEAMELIYNSVYGKNEIKEFMSALCIAILKFNIFDEKMEKCFTEDSVISCVMDVIASTFF